MKTFTVNEDCNLKDFTDFNYPQGAFAFAQLLRARDIKINGARTSTNVALKRGDVVTYYTTAAQESKTSHHIIYEDDNVLIADKLDGVTTEGLLSELCLQKQLFAVHRLDRNTKGVIAFAKSRKAEKELVSAFRKHSVNKTYHALCKDNFTADKGVLTAYLKKDSARSLVHIYDRMDDGAEKIVTEYSILERRENLALAEIILHTGKTHQIRAHLAHIGCPVVGDNKYGDEELNKSLRLSRQQLIAKKLSISSDGMLSYLNGKIFESRFNISFTRT